MFLLRTLLFSPLTWRGQVCCVYRRPAEFFPRWCPARQVDGLGLVGCSVGLNPLGLMGGVLEFGLGWTWCGGWGVWTWVQGCFLRWSCTSTLGWAFCGGSRVSAFRRWSLYPCWSRVMSRLSVFLLEMFATAFLAVIVFLVVNVEDLWGECVVSMQMLRLWPGVAEDGCCVPEIQSLLFPGLAVWE